MTKSESYELNIARTFEAPRDVVYSIWTTREHVVQWWAPNTFATAPDADWDFRVGGAFRIFITSQTSGNRNGMSGNFLEIVPSERIVFTFRWDPGNDPIGQETLITVTFSEENGRTTQTFHQTPFLSADTRDSHIGGWSGLIEREQGYAERLAQQGAKK